MHRVVELPLVLPRIVAGKVRIHVSTGQTVLVMNFRWSSSIAFAPAAAPCVVVWLHYTEPTAVFEIFGLVQNYSVSKLRVATQQHIHVLLYTVHVFVCALYPENSFETGHSLKVCLILQRALWCRKYVRAPVTRKGLHTCQTFVFSHITV